MADRGRGYEVAVLGAGPTGAAVAYALGRRRISPVVIDVSRGDSAAPVSTVTSVLHGAVPDMRLAIRSAERFPDLQDVVGPFGYRRSGGLWAALTEAEAEIGRLRAAEAGSADLPIVWLSRTETLRRDPVLSDRVVGAVYSGYDGVADAPALARRLLGAATRFGGTAHVDCGYVLAVRQSGGFRITAGREEVVARRLVVASAELFRSVGRSLGAQLPLRAARRRVCVTEHAKPVLRHTVSGIRQNPTGEFVLDPPVVVEERGGAGDVAEFVEGLRSVVTAAVQLVPAVAQTRILHAPLAVHVEPADGRPAVGRLDDDLYVAIPSAYQAVIMAPVIGEAIAEAVTKHRWPDGLEIWAPERFSQTPARPPAGAMVPPGAAPPAV